jgi:hypothetical protein
MVVVGADGTRRVVLLAGEGPPGLAVVEGLARFQLLTRRAGGRMWLEDVSPALGELLDLTGLRREVAGQASLSGRAAVICRAAAVYRGAALCRQAALRRETGLLRVAEGQAEGRKEALGVQEEVKACDPVP